MSDRSYWERHARKYDASLRLFLGRPVPRMLELAGEAVRGRRRVLEVAAGTGVVTAAIARTCENVIATDYAEAMVEVLMERVTRLRLDNVTCHQADLYDLPFEANHFDAVVAANVLHLVPDFAGAIAALSRVLQPSGILVAPTFCHDETRASRLISRVLSISRFPGQRRFTGHTLRTMLEDNGIDVTRAEILPGPIPIGHVEGTVAGDQPAGNWRI